MNLIEIKKAIGEGKTVCWSTDAYTVIKDKIGQYLIAYGVGTRNENYIGLTWSDGLTLNGKENEFYIKSPVEYGPASQSEGRVNRPVGDNKITFIGGEKKTIRQLWNDIPRPFPIKDEDYLKLINFISASANWKIIFYPNNPNYDYDIFTHFSLWDCSAEKAMEKVMAVIIQKKKEIAEDNA